MCVTIVNELPVGRWDIYGPVHKGLRLAHADMMLRLGRADFAAPAEELIAAMRAHLALCAQHLAHEEQVIHPALEARRPGGSSEIAHQHEEHRAGFDRIEGALAALEQAPAADRPRLGRALSLAWSLFVAEDLEHMRHEEAVVWPQLCALFTDEELMGLEMAIIGSLSPDENMAFMRIMLPAMNSPERLGLLGGMKQNAPPEAYAAVIEFAARPTLPAAAFAELQQVGLAA